MQKIVVCGQSRLTQNVVAALIQCDLTLSVALSAPDPMAIAADSFTVMSQLGGNDYQKATAKTFEQADVLVITDYGEFGDSDWQDEMLLQMRKVLGVAMGAGFGGKLVIATHLNGLMTYFAQRFSGLGKDTVMGLGTMGNTAVFEHAVAATLDVPRGEVTAYVVGSLQTPVLMWSRAYVAATPLLSLLQPVDGQPHPLMQQATEAVVQFAGADAALLWPPLVVQVLAALAGDAQILTLSVFDADAVVATPVLINATGIESHVTLRGSDAEQGAWQEVIATLQTQIDAIENGGTNE